MYTIYFTSADNTARPQAGMPAGNIDFKEDQISFDAIAGGTILRFGYSINLTCAIGASLFNLTAELSIVTGDTNLSLGIAAEPASHVIDTTHEFPHGLGRNFTVNGTFCLPLTLASLESIERRRQGGDVEFIAAIRGTVLVRSELGHPYEPCKIDINGGPSSPIRIRVGKDRWINCLRSMSKFGSVLVEIPLPVARSSPWNEVWKHLEGASVGLAQGGEIGWKSCTSEIRHAIEEWRKIDRFSSKVDRNKNKQERIQDIANALFHFCSLAAHSDEHTSTWNRADAIVAVACLSALLAARDP
ncbi:MAG: hypothetical protein ACYC0M_08495 [Burkholderiales bacterium]